MKVVNAYFLRFSRIFGVFGAASREDREALSDVVLRRLVAVGYAIGAATMAVAVISSGDRVGPPVGAWSMVAVFAALSLITWLGKDLPAALIRVICFDLTVLLLLGIIAFGYGPAYIALFYFAWPALTSSHFGSARDYARTMAEIVVGLPIALAVSDVAVPVLAYGGVLAASGVSSLVVRAIVVQALQLFDELEYIASRDALTGLLNRRAATTALQEAVARAHRQNTDLSIVTFDIDHFKRINDSLGHPAGDAALCRFAEVLTNSCSGTDVAARLGGEEFLVVLLRSDESGARAFAERFSEALDFTTANDPAPLSVSAGVVALDDVHPDADSLLVAADRALYAAKRSGRHRVIAASDAGVGPLAPGR
ncbi:MAG: diguanylate cyclase [Solirubrobacteraceae bacterium]|nr:diguanylate cyclase [Patulibacter sp.]